MNRTQYTAHATALSAITLLAILIGGGALVPTKAHAQDRATYLWLAESSTEVGATDVESALSDVVRGAADTRHIVGNAGLEAHLSRHGLDVPRCIAGLEPCAGAVDALLEELGVNFIVRVTPQGSGTTLEVRVSDARFNETSAIRINASSMRDALFRAVGELTNATGTIVVNSIPAATLTLNGDPVGTTPYRGTMRIGAYSLRVHADGYFDRVEEIEVRPGQNTAVTYNLERRTARFTVRSGTPGAWVLLGEDPSARAINEEIEVEPGEYTVRVGAVGYDEAVETIVLAPGDDREFSVNLLLSEAELRRRARQRILDRPILVQTGLSFGRFNSSWNGADLVDGDNSISCAIRPTTGACERAGVSSLGLNIDAIYTWRFLEVAPLGFSARVLLSNQRGVAYRPEVGADTLVHRSGNRFALRLLHVGGRHLINDVFEPYGRLGITLAWDRLRADILSGTNQGNYAFKRRSTLLDIRAGSRFHINSLLYAYGELDLSFDLNNGGTRPEFGVQAGVGLNLPDIFGLNRRLDRAGRGASDSVPGDL